MTIHKANWLLVGLVFLALWPAHAPGQGGQWESYITAGQQAYQQADYAEAEKQFEAALKEAEAFGPDDVRLATSLDNLATIYRAQGKFGKAEPLAKRALAIVEKALGPRSPKRGEGPGELRRPTTKDRTRRRGGKYGSPRQGDPRQARQGKPVAPGSTRRLGRLHPRLPDFAIR